VAAVSQVALSGILLPPVTAQNVAPIALGNPKLPKDVFLHESPLVDE
jgi:hypothetical protein